jgi:hypothetical protein
VGVLVGLILVACGTASPITQVDQPEVTSHQTASEEQSIEVTTQPAASQTADIPDTNQVIMPNIEVAPETEPNESPIIKNELEATDPSMVVLASGQPQLVEFFAFW